MAGDGIEEEHDALLRVGLTASALLAEAAARRREREARDTEAGLQVTAGIDRARAQALAVVADVADDYERDPARVARERYTAAAVLAADDRARPAEVADLVPLPAAPVGQEEWISPAEAADRPQEWLRQRVESGDLSPAVEARAREFLADTEAQTAADLAGQAQAHPAAQAVATRPEPAAPAPRREPARRGRGVDRGVTR